MECESSLWTLFTKKEEFIATCNSCQKDYSYRASVSNLRKHWARKHGGHLSSDVSVSDRNNDDSDQEQENPVAEVSNKVIWKFFTQKGNDEHKASCLLCNRNVSYKSLSELTQHVRDHGQEPKDKEAELYELERGVQQKILKRNKKPTVLDYFEKTKDKKTLCLLCDTYLDFSITDYWQLWHHMLTVHEHIKLDETVVTKRREGEQAVAQMSDKDIWRNFKLTGGDECEATCKICDRNVPYEFVSELKQHLLDHEEKPKESDDKDYVPEVQQKILKRKYKSKVWDYFEAIDDKMAMCLLCKKILNFSSSISNLRKHLQRIHKEINLTEIPVARTIYLNGELYEIANEQELEENEGNVETIEMDPIYLSNDLIEKSPTSSPKEKQPKILPIRNFSKVLEEPVHSTKNTCSEILEPRKKEIPSYKPTNDSSIEYFGQYVVSLLKELPKPVSDRLQSEIIKQIFTSKTALDSQAAAATYEIKICQNDKIVTNTPEPVCYTVVQTNEAAEK